MSPMMAVMIRFDVSISATSRPAVGEPASWSPNLPPAVHAYKQGLKFPSSLQKPVLRRRKEHSMLASRAANAEADDPRHTRRQAPPGRAGGSRTPAGGPKAARRRLAERGRDRALVRQCYLMRNGMTSRATMLMTLIIGLMAGPAVSL